MFKTIRKTMTSLLAVAALLVVPVVAAPALVSAQADIQECLGQGSSLQVPENQSGTTTCTSQDLNESNSQINSIITTVINIFSLVVGIVSVIMIIFGGLKYVTSGGDSNNVSSAKNTIIYAIIGLVIVALAQFIVQFVLNKVTTT